MQFSKVVFLAFLVCPSILVGDHEESVVSEQDKKRYEDLNDDDSDKRFLKVFLDPGYGHAKQRVPEQWVEIDWARAQGEDAFPVLLEVLKRESNDDLNLRPHPWIGVERKMHVLNWVESHPDGDPKPFLEEVRRQLPEWSERQIADHDTHTGFIREALNLLAREGDESDIPLIESFLGDVNRNNKHNAEKSLIRLKERLALEPKRRPRRANNRDNPQKLESSSRKNEKTQSEEEIVGPKKSSLPWIIAGVLLVGILLLLFKTFKGKSTS